MEKSGTHFVAFFSWGGWAMVKGCQESLFSPIWAREKNMPLLSAIVLIFFLALNVLRWQFCFRIKDRPGPTAALQVIRSGAGATPKRSPAKHGLPLAAPTLQMDLCTSAEKVRKNFQQKYAHRK